MKEIQDLIFVYLNGDANDEQTHELFQWVNSSRENAKEFARASLMHGELRNVFGGEQKAKEFGAISQPDSQTENTNQPIAKHNQRKRLTIVMSALAASIIVAIVVYSFWPKGDSDAQIAKAEFATLQLVSDVQWAGNGFNENDRLGAQKIEFKSGIVRLQFDNGVDVTLEGPSTFELVSKSATKLIAGVLMANVPAGAEGFQVDTPSAKVTDLGTSFGVNVGTQGTSEVLVFDGEVEISSGEIEAPQKITEGQSARLSSSGELQLTDFNSRRFDRLLRFSSGIKSLTGACQFIPPWPRRIRTVTSDEVFVVPEGIKTQLKSPLTVNISEAGDYRDASGLSPIDVPSGTRVHSYLMHYFPTEKLGRRRAKTVTGSVTFEQPIIGLIVLHDELVASSHLSRLLAGENQIRRELELGGPRSDRIKLSDDRRTVTVELTSPRNSADLIRVIVETKPRMHDIRTKGKRKKRRKNNQF